MGFGGELVGLAEKCSSDLLREELERFRDYEAHFTQRGVARAQVQAPLAWSRIGAQWR